MNWTASRIGFGAVLALVASAPLQAQADMRYTGASRMTYASVDSLSTTMQPMGVTMSAVTRARVALELTPSDSGSAVKATIREFAGSVNTPMGEQPLPGPAADASTTFHISAEGPDASGNLTGLDAMSNPGGEAVIKARGMAALPNVPNRMLQRGETWTDTLTLDDTVQGMTVKGTVHVRGTYRADTTVAGRTLNIIDYATVTDMTTSGLMQGQQVDQKARMEGTARLLWDSARHMPFMIEASNTMKADATVSGMPVNMEMVIRSVIREAEG